jgi:TRAP-type mannitol/chloroaromatic compound transport system substrate-binding protein
MELHQELGSLFNLKSFLCGNTAMQPGGWFNTEITSAEDLQGLRFRMPGQGGQVLGRLGASVQNIPGGEIYQALASGQIDGAEWIGPFADERLGFQEITNLYYTSGFHEPGSALSLAMNLDVFESLTPGQQKVVEIACEATHANNLGMSLAENGAALARLVSEGVQVRQFPNDVWDAFGRASAEVREENMGDPIYAEVAESYFSAMDETSAWWEIGDGEYIRQRNRVNAG